MIFTCEKYGLSAEDITFEINPESPAKVRLQAGIEFFHRIFGQLIATSLTAGFLITIPRKIQEVAS